MRGILIAILLGALAGGLGSYWLLPQLISGDRKLEMGGVTIEYEADVFSRNELLLGVFLAALIGALVASVSVWVASQGRASGKTRRKR